VGQQLDAWGFDVKKGFCSFVVMQMHGGSTFKLSIFGVVLFTYGATTHKLFDIFKVIENIQIHMS
jgi:hypothetical protein